MGDRPYLVGALLGAAVGSAFGYLFFTEAGEQRRRDLTRMVDRLMGDFQEVRALWDRVHTLAEQYQKPGPHGGPQQDFHFGSTGGVS